MTQHHVNGWPNPTPPAMQETQGNQLVRHFKQNFTTNSTIDALDAKNRGFLKHWGLPPLKRVPKFTYRA